MPLSGTTMSSPGFPRSLPHPAPHTWLLRGSRSGDSKAYVRANPLLATRHYLSSQKNGLLRWQWIQWLKHRPATPPHPHHTHRFKLQGTQYLLSQMLAPINTSLPQVFAKWGCQILYFLTWLCCFVMTHKWLKKHPGTDWECMSCWIGNVASWPGVSWSALAWDKTRAIWLRGHQLNDLPSFF